MSLSPNARAYAEQFIRSQGFDPQHLGEERLDVVFRRLSREEEFATARKHNGHNWESCYLPLAQQAALFNPELDLTIRRWHGEGYLPRLRNAAPLWPDGKRFALLLTHDVDSVSGSSLKTRARWLRTFRSAPASQRALAPLGIARELLRMIRPGNHTPDPPLEIWLEVEQRFGFRSSFFFLADRPPAENWEDAFYRHSDRIMFEGRHCTVAEVMREIADRGWDVGLHGASASSNDPGLLAEERRSIERATGRRVATIRQHHLIFDIRHTPRFQALAGFRAGTSMGSNRSVGFRCGTSFPFPLYDRAADAPLDLNEVPLTVQDCVLFRHLQLDEDMAFAQCMELMEQVSAVQGVFTLLWHNDAPPDSPEFRVYERLLGQAARHGAWGCSLAQLDEWWRARECSAAIPDVAESLADTVNR